jgi:hypothetical protein
VIANRVKAVVARRVRETVANVRREVAAPDAAPRCWRQRRALVVVV